MFIPNIYDYNNIERIIVIGDIHGDIKRFKNILIDASIINNDLEWIAQPLNTFVVQVGDQIDSANRDINAKEWEILNDINMINFTDTLDKIAIPKGGRVISLIGNHELMNVIGNFSYVSKNSYTSERINLFKPQGILSNILGNRPIVLKIGEHFFCHAGIKKEHLELLSSYNKDISYINEIWQSFLLNNKIQISDKELFDMLILNDSGILWTRTFDDIEYIDDVLNKLNCSYIYTGHNLVDNIKLYNNRIWQIDNGISRAFGKSYYQYLEIINGSFQIKTIYE